MADDTEPRTCEHGETKAHGVYVKVPKQDWPEQSHVRACPGPVAEDADAARPTCPNCGHATPHEDEVCYCEVPGCDCDRTSVESFYAPAAAVPEARPTTLVYHEDCDCGGFDRNGSHNAGGYQGYCAGHTAVPDEASGFDAWWERANSLPTDNEKITTTARGIRGVAKMAWHAALAARTGPQASVESLARVAHETWAKMRGKEPHYEALAESEKDVDRALVQAILSAAFPDHRSEVLREMIRQSEADGLYDIEQTDDVKRTDGRVSTAGPPAEGSAPIGADP